MVLAIFMTFNSFNYCKYASCSVLALRTCPLNTIGLHGLAGVDLIKDLAYVSLGEQDQPVLWVGDGPHTRCNVVIVEACNKCIEFIWYRGIIELGLPL